MFFYARYRRELAAARCRIQLSGSSIVETTRGRIEQVTFGEGPTVLLVHGVVGGADQGRGLADAYFGDGFKVVAVSRFGYVRTPLPADSSPRAQADQYAALLDVLGIDKVAVVGTSAGTASCLQFGLSVRFRAIESGGHLLLGNRQAVGAEIAQFVREHARAAPTAAVKGGA